MTRSGIGRLWAPWRMEYVQRASYESKRKPRQRRKVTEECLFCRVGGAKRDRADLVLARRPLGFIMLNRFPYNPGHLMVAVARHVESFAGLTADEGREMVELIALAERALGAEYRPSGMNYGVNTGRVAGAGVLGHLHVHLVPRWDGDTNFMPVVGETKVLPESLDRTWSRLRAALKGPGKPRGGRRGA